MSRLTPARRFALDIIRQVRQRKAYAKRLIDSQMHKAALTESERAFATLLINGVIASRGTLDEIIDRALDKPTRIRPDVRDALRITSYELIFLDKDVHAAVDQGVELTRSVSPRASGLANKLLRRIATQRQSFPWGDIDLDDAALARQQAFPLWLTQRLIADLGREGALRFMQASNQAAPLFVAVNQLAGEVESTTERLIELGAERSSFTVERSLGKSGIESFETTAYRLPAQSLSGLKSLIDAGRVLICDESAQRIAALSTPLPDEPFLEVGSGRGTKTVLLQRNAWLDHGRQSRLVALDLHPFKTQILLERIAQYQLENVQPVSGDILDIDALIVAHNLPDNFGGILIDAPCSGTGTLRRHPEIRWKLNADDIDCMADSGLGMLMAAARHIKRGGFIVYSTCSVFRQENEQLVDRFLATPEGRCFQLAEACTRVDLVPSGPDAHFAARLIHLS